MDIDPEQIARLPLQDQKEILKLLRELDLSKKIEASRLHFLDFVKFMWPDFVEGYHHKIIAKLFDEVLDGQKKRVIINMPPRHTKSEFASIYLPAYFLGRNPNKKVIQTSHTAELAVGFGRKVRNLVDRKDFQTLFPVNLSADSKAAGRWATSRGGEYFAIGVGGAIAGKGADLFIIDDPHSEQDAIIGESNPEIYQRVMEWYEGGPRQRLQPGGAIIVVMTRWSLRDLTGSLLRKQLAESTGDKWEVVELPAVMPANIEKGLKERPIWPEYWKMEELMATKASIPISKWNAQYQQNPTAEEGALIKREYWMKWDEVKPPKCQFVIQSWDTAFTAGTRSDYSACTTWGIFVNEETEKNNIILLDAERGKWEFPQLKDKALRLYQQHEPDIVLIEGRAAGQPLVQELRRMGIPIAEFTVGRGASIGGGQSSNNKISRVNAITDVFASKNVWAPREKKYAQEVIEECAAFPAGEHDDYVDTVTMAIQRFRNGGWVGTENDYEEKDEVGGSRFEYY